MARFSSRARGDSTAALALSRKGSRPPLWSTLLIALVETRRRTLRPSASLMKVTLTRFGRKRRLVLMLECLTVWPTWGPLAVNSQRRDMAKSSIFPNDVRPPFGAPRANLCPCRERATYRGEAAGRQGFGAGFVPHASCHRPARRL